MKVWKELRQKSYRNRFLPHLRVQSLSEVNIASLKEDLGIEYLLLDKCNSVTRTKSSDVWDRDTWDALKNCQEIYGDKFAVLSNDRKWDGFLNYGGETVNYIYSKYNR